LRRQLLFDRARHLVSSLIDVTVLTRDQAALFRASRGWLQESGGSLSAYT
jgi:hypothetical protein